jgi:hypothetical protein
MTQLTEDQKQFLNSKGVIDSEIFDATNLKKSEYSKLMRELDYKVAYGVTPCAKGNHSLRDRNGNCLQCNPLILAYAKNHNDGGYVYIAHSKSSKLIKIGSTSNISKRGATLKEHQYGSQSDWEIAYYTYVEKKRGAIETEIQTLLKEHYVISHYFKNGVKQSTYEIFNCSVNKALSLLKEVVAKKVDITAKLADHSSDASTKLKKVRKVLTEEQREALLPIKHKYAEAWLDEACQLISDFYKEKGFEVSKVRVLFGFTTSGHDNRKSLGNHEGECLSKQWTDDETIIILVTPLVERAIIALSVLAHELVHAIDNCKSDHGSDFLQNAKTVGFDVIKYNKKVEIVLSDFLHKKFTTYAEQLGRFPSIKLKKLNSN